MQLFLFLKNKNIDFLYIEKPSFGIVCQILLTKFFQSLFYKNKIKSVVYYFFESKFTYVCKLLFSNFLKLTYMDAVCTEIKDEEGRYLREIAHSYSLTEYHHLLEKSKEFNEIISEYLGEMHLHKYLAKEIARFHPGYDSNSTFNRLFNLHIVNWHSKEYNIINPIFITFRSPFDFLIRELTFVKNSSLYFISYNHLFALRSFSFKTFGLYFYIRFIFHYIKKFGKIPWRLNRDRQLNNSHRIMMESYGAGNLTFLENFSDLFFMNENILDWNCVSLHWQSQNPLPKEDRNLAKVLGVELILTHPNAYQSENDILFSPKFFYSRCSFLKQNKSVLYGKSFIQDKVSDFSERVNYYEDFYIRNNIRIYLCWYKYDSDHIAKAKAMENIGGVFALWQRSAEEYPSSESTAVADVNFVFSANNHTIEKKQLSKIKYQVVTGYLGDYRFKLNLTKSKEIRNKLKRNGVKRILSYFDFGSNEFYPRIYPTSKWIQYEYEFLLDCLLENDWFGLLIKTKYPKTLFERLGNLSKKLNLALSSGRCIIISNEYGNETTPCIASLASDISVQTFIFSCTAALESVLSGTNTVFIDRFGFPDSMYYQLGKSKVVFSDFEHFWRSWLNDKEGTIGAWGDFIKNVDPFRDGKASSRMVNFLKETRDGLVAGMKKEEILYKVSSNYKEKWGSDKVVEIF